MCRALALFVCSMTCLVGTTFGQSAGSIDIFSLYPVDGGCNLVDNGGLIQLEVLHVHTTGATASQFKLDVSNIGWTHLGDVFDFATTIGRSITGTSVAYGSCLTGPVHLVTVNFAGSQAPPCTYVSIVPDPGALSGKIEAADCATPMPNKIFPTGGQAIVNATAQCPCSVPAEKKTWGLVKALYF